MKNLNICVLIQSISIINVTSVRIGFAQLYIILYFFDHIIRHVSLIYGFYILIIYIIDKLVNYKRSSITFL